MLTPPSPPPARTAADALLVALFLAAIVLPPIAYLAGIGPSVSLTEKRALAPLPPLIFDAQGLQTFHRNFEAYWNDAFGFRSTLVRAYNRLALTMGVAPSSKVVIGKAGWLYVGQYYSAVEYYRATRPFTAAELESWQHALEARRDWLGQRGIHYLFIVVPDKQTIYPEYMPATLNRVGTMTRLDQLVAHLEQHSDLRILDLRDALRETKAHDRPYERLDSHWNDLGAWVAYAEIVKQLGRWFPQMAPLPLSSFERTTSTDQGNDLAMLLSLSDLMPGERLTFVPRVARQARWVSADGTSAPDSLAVRVSETDDPTLPRAVMFHDSFGPSLEPFLAEHFSRIVFSWQHIFDPAVIEQEKPNLVLHEMVERTLMADLAGDPDDVTHAWGAGQAPRE